MAAAYRHDVAGSQFGLDLAVGRQNRLQFFTQNFDLNRAVEAENHVRRPDRRNRPELSPAEVNAVIEARLDARR